MDWVKRMNEAIGYIEEHITEEIDYAEVARSHCSVYHFQRMFPFITNVSLSEYIRRRRLTLAAYELQNSDIKVIDLALKYGYDSRRRSRVRSRTCMAQRRRRQTGTKLKAYPASPFNSQCEGRNELQNRRNEGVFRCRFQGEGKHGVLMKTFPVSG